MNRIRIFAENHLIFFGAIILDLFAFAANLFAARWTVFANAYSHTVFRFASLRLSRLMGIFHVSIVECLLFALCILGTGDLFYHLFFSWKTRSWKPLRALGGHVFLLLSFLYFLYTFNCSINYRRTSFSKEAQLNVTENYSKEELLKLCEYLVRELNTAERNLVTERQKAMESTTLSPEDPEDVNFLLVQNGAYIGQTEFTPEPNARWLFHAGTAGQHAMEALGNRYDRLSGLYPYPKPVLNSWILSVQQTTGVYSPFTLEANYNRSIPYYNIPFTICHELSHLRGYMQEQEANFIAILATCSSEDNYFRYSGYLNGWVYAGNALAKVDYENFSRLYKALDPHAIQDLKYNNAYWKRYEGEIAKVQEKVNDVYLKSNGQSHGVKSYGHVTDLMLQYYEKNGTLDIHKLS
jgi:hypothetical protein